MEGGLQETVGQRIKTARLAVDLSQEELAGRLGTSRYVVHRWERGHNQPNRKYRRRLAEEFGQPSNYFMNGSQP